MSECSNIPNQINKALFVKSINNESVVRLAKKGLYPLSTMGDGSLMYLEDIHGRILGTHTPTFEPREPKPNSELTKAEIAELKAFNLL